MIDNSDHFEFIFLQRKFCISLVSLLVWVWLSYILSGRKEPAMMMIMMMKLHFNRIAPSAKLIFSERKIVAV